MFWLHSALPSNSEFILLLVFGCFFLKKNIKQIKREDDSDGVTTDNLNLEIFEGGVGADAFRKNSV